jgi:hypothetical protein
MTVLDRVERMLAASRAPESPPCIVCKQPIRAGEPRMTVRGTLSVHQRCATYRMRQVAGRSPAAAPR